MVDLSDNYATRDIEQYTGMVVRPFLSAIKDIDKSINDYFHGHCNIYCSPQNSSKMTAIIASIALTMIVITISSF